MKKSYLPSLLMAVVGLLSLGCPGSQREHLRLSERDYRILMTEELLLLKSDYPQGRRGKYPQRRAEQWRNFMEKVSPLIGRLKSTELAELLREIDRIKETDRERYGRVPFILSQQIKEFKYRIRARLHRLKRETLRAYAEALKAKRRAELALSNGGSVRKLPFKGRGKKSLRLYPPLRGRWKVTSKFGWRRDPFTGKSKFHSGIDIPARTGRLVYPAAPGKVVHAGWFGGCGYTVIIRHFAKRRGEIKTYYCHLSKILTRKGKVVGRKTPIGRVGSSGRSTSPHLHFALSIDGIRRDPTPYLKAR